MKLSNAIAKAKKVTGQDPVIVGQFYHFTYKGHVISFACNGRLTPDATATNYKVQRAGDKDDAMTDYFAGSFCDNLTQAFKLVDYSTK